MERKGETRLKFMMTLVIISKWIPCGVKLNTCHGNRSEKAEYRKYALIFTQAMKNVTVCNDLLPQIDHVRHLFGFGSQMRSDFLVDPDYTQYQNIASHMFNWATIQEYKWGYNKGTQVCKTL